MYTHYALTIVVAVIKLPMLSVQRCRYDQLLACLSVTSISPPKAARPVDI